MFFQPILENRICHSGTEEFHNLDFGDCFPVVSFSMCLFVCSLSFILPLNCHWI